MVENDHDPHQNEIERKTRRYKRRSNQNCAASKIFGCDSCEKKFTALSSLNRHVLCHHSGKGNRETPFSGIYFKGVYDQMVR